MKVRLGTFALLSIITLVPGKPLGPPDKAERGIFGSQIFPVSQTLLSLGATSSFAPGGLPPAEGWRVGLVDEVRRFRNPIVVGGGTPFLPLVTEAVRLDLLETRAFEPRVIYERYGRTR